MTRLELAQRLSERVRRARLVRLGEPVGQGVPFAGLPAVEQRTWLDVADAVLELGLGGSSPVARLESLRQDWLRYSDQLSHDPGWMDEMRRAVVVELRVEVERLAGECGL